MKDLYIISYEPNGKGAPYFFDLDWVPDLPTFHYPSENPIERSLSASYRAIADTPEINADWLPDHYLASKNLLDVCDYLGCSYISRPIELDIQGKISEKEYFFFVASDRINAMDLERSTFTLDANPKIDASVSKNPTYERIEKLVIFNNIDSDLFYFEEIHEVVCSSDFRNAYIKKGLSGLSFKKIDEGYQYAPWDDF
ncbi:hypothetical protein PSTH1771_28195 [Pseudomonas syringae pv. theae]|uniref:Immunity MXAN-0049 protein domain-containing protein n=2 Tax=Pseudomonas syringae group TaxID=136849 RepID=S6TW11_PSESF|nr:MULTISPECIES: DUF1629 domain-containing protein [Pseudomonas syringae group]EPN30200.1 hypothetical protein A244_39018 [Pseudomonas syringae pv. actinidiae ICMP 18807]KPZ09776.1 Uncharacterized protein ALO40_03054 [Pseudomonas syringae pv. viburni]MBL3832000.1 hypothetical protein [Pseudomonas syringae pv. theae]MBL3833218.1 hypothetical protein [Pseudomonas syringae pv. theae]MBL3868262.1 hypothetical protein [Pseudomonas syringae pv. theae]